ncbi:MAG TPA: hypothetical protein VN228_03320 [Pyrinomonadaceae bacterium]|nr:hypothetical protein [Pyrinomonadaceae bacterium]
MSNEENALQPGGQKGLVTYAVLTGLTPLIPVPVLDDVVKGYFRRRLVRGLAAARGRALSEEEVAALADEGGDGCLRGCVVQAVVYPLKKIFRKVFYFLEWKRAADLTSQTYHFGYLVGYALDARGGGASLLDLHGAARVGAAVAVVCREAPIKPVESAVSGTFRQSRKALSSAAALLGQSLRRLAGRAPAPEVARALEEVEPREAREVEPVVTRLQRSLASVPDEHFRDLRARLDSRLAEPPT